MRLALALLALLPGVLSGGVFGPARQVREVNAAALAVDLEGDRLYVAAGTALSVFDVSRPLEPQLLGFWNLSGNPDAAAFCNGRVVIPAGHQGLFVSRKNFNNY